MATAAVGNKFVHNARKIGKQIFYESPKDFCKGAYRKGLPSILNDLSKDDGAEKVYKIAVWVLPLLGDRFKPANTAIKQTLGILYGTMIIKNIKVMVVDKKTTRYNVVSTVLLTIGSFSQLIRFITRELQIVQIPIFGEISNEMGKYKIFHLPVIQGLRLNPKDFFIFFGSIALSIEMLVKHIEDYKKAKKSGKDYDFIKHALSPLDILKHISNIGKVILISCSSFGAGHIWYIAIAGVTNMASLMTICIPKDNG
jgi:hypothetical protein